MLIVIQRLISLDRSFAGFESRAETFQAAQTRQAETQARLHNDLQIEMHITHELLDNITSSAKGLHTTIQTTTALIGHLGSLISNLRGATGWIPAVLCISSLLSALLVFRPKLALHAVGVIGQSFLNSEELMLIERAACTCFLYTYGFFDLRLSPASNERYYWTTVPLNRHILSLLAALSLLAVVSAIGTLHHFTNILACFRPRQLNIELGMPTLDDEKVTQEHDLQGP